MKDKIISLLKENKTEAPLSGVEISNRLGISRVAVWKHLNQLKKSGYDILSTPKGYVLKSEKDILIPRTFEKRADRIHYFSSLSSTMDKARELARKGADSFSVVIADEQTRGRGRLNRQWLSDNGGLWFTIILRPKLPPPYAFKVNFAASLSLSRVLKSKYNLDVGVKWPNDILLKVKKDPCTLQSGNFHERKIVGLLSEMETHGDMISFVNIGIGINVNNTPSRSEPNAISVRDVLGEEICRRELLVAFLDEFEMMIHEVESKKVESTELMEQWKLMTSTLGREVRIETFGDVYQGIAIDVDNSGALLLEQSDGSIRKVIYGDCFYSSSSH